MLTFLLASLFFVFVSSVSQPRYFVDSDWQAKSQIAWPIDQCITAFPVIFGIGTLVTLKYVCSADKTTVTKYRWVSNNPTCVNTTAATNVTVFSTQPSAGCADYRFNCNGVDSYSLFSVWFDIGCSTTKVTESPVVVGACVCEKPPFVSSMSQCTANGMAAYTYNATQTCGGSPILITPYASATECLKLPAVEGVPQTYIKMVKCVINGVEATKSPSLTPTIPSVSPTSTPTAPTVNPTLTPSVNPTMHPTGHPTTPSVPPTSHPTMAPTNATRSPTLNPAAGFTAKPSPFTSVILTLLAVAVFAFGGL